MKILEEIDAFMNYASIFFSKERELSYYGEKYRWSFVFLLENIVSSVKIKKSHRFQSQAWDQVSLPGSDFQPFLPSSYAALCILTLLKKNQDHLLLYFVPATCKWLILHGSAHVSCQSWSKWRNCKQNNSICPSQNQPGTKGSPLLHTRVRISAPCSKQFPAPCSGWAGNYFSL